MLMTKEIHKIAINQQWWNDIVEFEFIENVSKNQKIKIKNALESERKKSNLIMWELIQSDSFDLMSDQTCLLLARIENVNINIFFLFVSFSFFTLLSSHFFWLFHWIFSFFLIFDYSFSLSLLLISSDSIIFILFFFILIDCSILIMRKKSTYNLTSKKMKKKFMMFSHKKLDFRISWR